ncbi:hypothetical protein EBR78_10400 [bacterium]|nr:hypothetical protein [bacterium]
MKQALSLLSVFGLLLGLAQPLIAETPAKRSAPKRASERERLERERGARQGEHKDGCNGACGSISEGRGPAPEGSKKRPVEASETEKARRDVVDASVKASRAEVREEVRKSLEGQFQGLDNAARDGLRVREEAFVKSREKTPENEAEYKKLGREGLFLTDLVKRIKGSVKEQLETLKKLVCPSDCGHKGMARSCRVMAQLMKKLAVPATAAAITSLAITTTESRGGESKIAVNVEFEGAKAVSLSLDDKEQPEEIVSPSQSSR